MRLLTTQEFSGFLRMAYVRGADDTIGAELHRIAFAQFDGNLRELLNHAHECGHYLYHWENDLAVIKYFIDNFVEEF